MSTSSQPIGGLEPGEVRPRWGIVVDDVCFVWGRSFETPLAAQTKEGLLSRAKSLFASRVSKKMPVADLSILTGTESIRALTEDDVLQDVSESFTQDAFAVLQKSFLLARELDHKSIDLLHILQSVFTHIGREAVTHRLGLSRSWYSDVQRELSQKPLGGPTEIGDAAEQLILSICLQVQASEDLPVRIDHILEALIRDPGLSQTLESCQMNQASLELFVYWLRLTRQDGSGIYLDDVRKRALEWLKNSVENQNILPVLVSPTGTGKQSIIRLHIPEVTVVSSSSEELPDEGAVYIDDLLAWVSADESRAEQLRSQLREGRLICGGVVPKQEEALLHGALGTVVETIPLAEPSVEDAARMLMPHAWKIEVETGVHVTLHALYALCAHANRYVFDAFLPGSVIGLLRTMLSSQARGTWVGREEVTQWFFTTQNIARPEQKRSQGNGGFRLPTQPFVAEQLTGYAKRLRVEKMHKGPRQRLLFVGGDGVGKQWVAKKYIRTFAGPGTPVHLLTAEDVISSCAEQVLPHQHPFAGLYIPALESVSKDQIPGLTSLLSSKQVHSPKGDIDLSQRIVIVSTTLLADTIRQRMHEGVSLSQIQELVRTKIGQQLPEGLSLDLFDGVVCFEPITPIRARDLARALIEQHNQLERFSGSTIAVSDDELLEWAKKHLAFQDGLDAFLAQVQEQTGLQIFS